MWLCHFPEVPAPLVDVAYWGKTGRHLLAMSSSQFDRCCQKVGWCRRRNNRIRMNSF